ncbi:MAG: TIGR00730 family Rossman fold protein, partial [Pseudomonadota bacterium]
KPIILSDVEDFWSPFLTLVEHMRSEAFIRPGIEIHLTSVSDPAEIVPTAQRLVAESEKAAEDHFPPEKF